MVVLAEDVVDAPSEVDGLGRPVVSSFFTRFLGVLSVDGGGRFLEGFSGEVASFLIETSASSFFTVAVFPLEREGCDAAAAARVVLAMVLRSIYR